MPGVAIKLNEWYEDWQIDEFLPVFGYRRMDSIKNYANDNKLFYVYTYNTAIGEVYFSKSEGDIVDEIDRICQEAEPCESVNYESNINRMDNKND